MWQVPGIELEGGAVAPRVHLHILRTVSANQLNSLNHLRARTKLHTTSDVVSSLLRMQEEELEEEEEDGAYT